MMRSDIARHVYTAALRVPLDNRALTMFWQGVNASNYKPSEYQSKINMIEPNVLTNYTGQNVKDAEWSGLHLAVCKGDIEKIENLLDTDCTINVNQQDTLGRTALHLAVALQNENLVTMLLNKGADPKITDKANWTPLHLAIYTTSINPSQKPIFKVLVEKFGDINFSIEPTLLECAANYENLELAKTLIEKGANITPRAFYSIAKTPNVNPEYVREIIRLSSNPEDIFNENNDDDPEPLLHKLVDKVDIKIIKILVENGADINILDDSDSTILHRASALGELDLIKSLLEKGANPTAVDEEGRTPLHHLAGASITDKEPQEILNLLIEIYRLMIRNCAGSDKDDNQAREDFNAKCLYKQDDYGNTPIHISAQNGENIQVFFALHKLSQPLSMTIKNNDGYTPLDCAVIYDATAQLELLLESMNINFNVLDDKGQTILHKAALFGSKQDLYDVDFSTKVLNMAFAGDPDTASTTTPSLHVIARYIRKNKIPVDINKQDKNGDTPLHLAVSTGFAKNISALMMFYNCDPTIRNNKGQTPLDLAKNLYLKGFNLVSTQDKTEMQLIHETLLHSKGGAYAIDPDNPPVSIPQRPDEGSQLYLHTAYTPSVAVNTQSNGYFPSKFTNNTHTLSREIEKEEIEDDSDTENDAELRGSGKRKRRDKD